MCHYRAVDMFLKFTASFPLLLQILVLLVPGTD